MLKVISTSHDCWEEIFFCKVPRQWSCCPINMSSITAYPYPLPLSSLHSKGQKKTWASAAQIPSPRGLSLFSTETDSLLETLIPLFRLCCTSHAAIFCPLRTAKEYSAYNESIQIPALWNLNTSIFLTVQGRDLRMVTPAPLSPYPGKLMAGCWKNSLLVLVNPWREEGACLPVSVGEQELNFDVSAS